MHRKGHVGITLLFYSPVILVVGYTMPQYLPVFLIGAVLLADVLMPVTVAIKVLWGRRVNASFSPAMLPDLDMKLPGVKHRGITHTLWFAVGVAAGSAALGGLIVFGIGGTSMEAIVVGAVFLGYLGFHAVVTHILGDVLTPTGIRPFAPLNSIKYSLGIVKASNPVANVVCYVCGLAAVGAAILVVL